MRSCCEKTLGVLRQNKESLIIIIEVIIDPDSPLLPTFCEIPFARQDVSASSLACESNHFHLNINV